MHAQARGVASPNPDITTEREPGYEHKRPWLMSADGREIVEAGYTMVCTYREIQSRTQVAGNARQGWEIEHKEKGNELAVESSSVTKSMAPSIKLGPRWCLIGLTKTQH
jgi:hypothetical protein